MSISDADRDTVRLISIQVAREYLEEFTARVDAAIALHAAKCASNEGAIGRHAADCPARAATGGWIKWSAAMLLALVTGGGGTAGVLKFLGALQ